MRKRLFSLGAGLLFSAAAVAGPCLDQIPPGNEPTLFAPGIVATGMNERDTAITPDGKEIYWSANLRNFEVSVVMFTRQTESGWSEPAVAPFSRDPSHSYLEPAVSPDGEKFFFVVSGPGGEGSDIWAMDREAGDWGKPRKLPAPVNTPGKEFFLSVTREGTLYFTREDETPDTDSP